jgi:hypothetical protein
VASHAIDGPTLEAAHDQSGDFLLANCFHGVRKHVPASDQLWSQFEGRDDLVYYDWELTGLRVLQWRLLTELLPVFPPPTPRITPRQKAAKNAKPPQLRQQQPQIAAGRHRGLAG